MYIKQLDKNLANMIAAGEVVERPASAVKELCENSVDAGASSITVEIKGGGISMIKVTDNGCGIHPDDVENAFKRHATSKIATPEDLNNIYTFGFRGEALASIASVAKVTLYTRMAEFDEGMQACANYGEITDVAPMPGFVGTSIKIEDLFYTTPARLKFLKKEATEAGYIEETVRKTALAHPEVSFRLITDGKEKLFTPGDGNLKNTVFTIYGKQIADQLDPVDYKDENIRVTGLISNPVFTKKTRSMQVFFVNNRPVVSRMLMTALEEAYKNIIPHTVHPVGIIKLDVPAGSIDINVHPAKLEVKFSDESRIYRAVYWAVKNALAKPVMPKITDETPLQKHTDFDIKAATEHKPEMANRQVQMTSHTLHTPHTAPQKSVAVPEKSGFESIAQRAREMAQNFVATPAKKAETQGSFNFASSEKTESTAADNPTVIKADSMPHQPPQNRNIDAAKTVQVGELVDKSGVFTVVGQIFCTYIIVEKGSDVILVDQHAAHEHINYAKLVKQSEQMSVTSQSLLAPEILTLSPAEKAIALENSEFFASAGFEIDDFGNNDICIRSVPQVMGIDSIAPVFEEILSNFKQGKVDITDEMRKRALYTVACRSSIKAGKRMTMQEMETLVRDLFEIDKTITCPHGRPAWVVMDKTFIEKQFKRLM